MSRVSPPSRQALLPERPALSTGSLRRVYPVQPVQASRRAWRRIPRFDFCFPRLCRRCQVRLELLYGGTLPARGRYKVPCRRQKTSALPVDDFLLYPEIELSIFTNIASTESRISSGFTSTPFRLSFTAYVPPWAKPVMVIYLSRCEHDMNAVRAESSKKNPIIFLMTSCKAKYLYKGSGFSN